MRIVTEINSCNDCQYRDHSGAFTPGGARPICNHQDKVRTNVKEHGDDEGYHWKRRVIPHKVVYDEVFQRNVREPTKIPAWCPLRKLAIA